MFKTGIRGFFVIVLSVLIASVAYTATTGKISGVITDNETGEPLPGVNVVLQGTSLGAATDSEGQFVILNVPPDTYTLQASMIGYATHTVSNVRVEIELTTTIDIQMRQEAIAGEQVEVVAERKIIKKDVSASQRSVTSDEIEALPASDVGDVLGMKAGIEQDLSIRGSQSGEAIFMVDGIVLRDERNNEPMSGLPLSAMQEISVQTGGFGAEYNNVRSGVVNVVTKEGSPKYYSGTITVKYSPPSQKHFGISPYNPNSYWVRPYLDDEVAWTGTDNGAWDQHTLRQYPEFLGGWQRVSRESLIDDDPTNDLTPAAAQRLFEWQYRKKGWIQQPDRTIDFGFGGPVPFAQSLGNMRFFLSHRNIQEMYLFGLSRDGLYDQNTMLKLTSDLGNSTKLSVIGIYGEMDATAESRSGGTDYMSGPWDLVAHINRSGFTVPWRIYTDEYWSQTSRYYNTLSAKLTKVLSSGEFFEVQLKRIGKLYRTGPSALRDTSATYELFPGYYVNEAPKGFWPNSLYSIDGRLSFGGAISTARDRSEFTTWTGKFDYTNQVNFRHQIKSGFEIIYNSYNMEFGMVNEFLPLGNTWTSFERNPYRITGYIQDKIEYEGFITTIGVVPEYINSNGNWYDVSPYSRDFYSANYSPEQEDEFKDEEVEPQFYLSPRIGVSHPITENSKLYFNYGHYRQMPTSETHYRMQRSALDQVDYIGNPSLPLARTISYELGYDHSLYDMYLIRLSAYYKSIDNQQDWTRYVSLDGKVNYYKLTAKNYEDIRGFEFEVSKRYGQWVTGNLNYEYRVGTSGYFGVKQYFENPAEQREYLRQNPYQAKPRPRPRFKSYIDFHTPDDFGPRIVGQRLFGGWSMNFITHWTAGFWTTWNPNNITGIEYNLQYRDYKNVDLKLSKVFKLGDTGTSLKFFAEINNAFNIKYFSNSSFVDVHDFEDYMYSLHLPKSKTNELGYKGIPGDDRPGDYRSAGAKFQPMDYVEDYTTVIDPDDRMIYYDGTTKEYMQYSDGQWNEVSSSRIDNIFEDKAYIDMPNQTFYTFLDPRDIFFGITITKSFR